MVSDNKVNWSGNEPLSFHADKKSRIKTRGVALITVLLIVALAAVLATQMTGRLQLQMQRTNNITLNQQAYWYAMGAEAFAKRILITSFENGNNVTNLEQMWAQGETSEYKGKCIQGEHNVNTRGSEYKGH